MGEGKNTPVPMVDPLLDFERAKDDRIEIIADRYIVKQMLGQGGMGRVFRAHDKLLNRDVAVKLLNRELCDEYFVRRFQQEARAASQLNHMNILCVLDFGLVSQTQPYLVMEWVDGLTLDQTIERDGRFTVKQSIEICIKLAEGMQHAHRNGIIHRDLKPSNIMLSRSELGDRVLILDFGIAKMVDDPKELGMLTMTGQIIGSPRCMSPEQARGESLDGRSDIYSLGCVMFEMLTGKPPYKGDTAMSTIAMHLNEPIPSIKDESETNFPENLDEIIRKTMAKNPDERFTSMHELCNQLKTLDLDPIIARPKPIVDPELEKPHGIVFSAPKVKIILSLLAILVIVFAVFAALNSMQEKETSAIVPKTAPKPDERLEKGSAYNLNPSFADDSAVDIQMKRSLKSSRGLSYETMVMPNDIKTGAELQKAFDERPKAFHMRLYATKITPDMVAVVEHIDRLQEIRLQSCDLSPDLQLRLCKMTNLNSVKFVDMPVPLPALKQLGKLPMLRNLQICKSDLTDQSLDEISKMKNLEVLEINNNKIKFSKTALKKIATLKKLDHLQLLDAKLDDSDIAWLKTLSQIYLLGLSGNKEFTPQGLKQLLELKKLEVLYLDDANLDNKCIFAVSKIARLRTLDISNNPNVTVGALQFLAHRQNLQVVVPRTGIDLTTIRRLSDELNIKLLESRPNSATNNNGFMDFLTPTN